MSVKAPLIETIRIHHGRVRRIMYHNARCNESRKVLFDAKDEIDLRKYIDTSKALSAEVKCRITYGLHVQKVEYIDYKIRPIRTLQTIDIDDFDYAFKYQDRRQILKYYDQRGQKDEILMIRNGLITDTSYCNVALLKAGRWYTPKNPLLEGTTRARLLANGRIIPDDIYQTDLDQYEKICLFNAMIPFLTMTIDTKK